VMVVESNKGLLKFRHRALLAMSFLLGGNEPWPVERMLRDDTANEDQYSICVVGSLWKKDNNNRKVVMQLCPSARFGTPRAPLTPTGIGKWKRRNH